MDKNQVIIIMTDTQRTDMLGCYGNKEMITPNLDRLAREGMRFDKAYTCQPVCGPARSAIFTGTYPHSNGSWGNSMPLGDNVKTIGQRLNDNGYNTAYIGKWHLDGGDYFGNGICPEGWDPQYWYDMRCYLEELTDEERLWSRKISIMEEKEVKEDFTFGHRCSDKAIDYLTKNSDEDFFLVVSYDEPHGPFVCPKPFSTMYEDYEFPKDQNVWDTLENKPEHQRAWAGDSINLDRDALKLKHQYFFGCNSFVDYEIGRVINAIDQFAPDALVIYTSDHGDALQSHCLHNKGASMYDEITNIPFIVRWPKVIKANQVNSNITSHIDIVPTILDVMGIPQSKLLEGRSMINTFKDTSKGINKEVFIEFNRYEIDHDGFGGFQPIRCAYDGQYKLCINLMTTDELYDTKKDPSEINNLIDNPTYNEIRNQLHDKILDWMNDTRDPFRGYYWERRPWRVDSRPATWDYTGYTRQRENLEYEPRQLDYATGLDIKKAVRKK